MLHVLVFLKELQALIAVDFLHIVTELVATAEDFVKLAIAESDDAVVINSTAVVDLADVGPHAGTETHVARLASSI